MREDGEDMREGVGSAVMGRYMERVGLERGEKRRREMKKRKKSNRRRRRRRKLLLGRVGLLCVVFTKPYSYPALFRKHS